MSNEVNVTNTPTPTVTFFSDSGRQPCTIEQLAEYAAGIDAEMRKRGYTEYRIGPLQSQNYGNPTPERLVNEKIPQDSREGLLRAAIRCVTKDRNATHGNPEDNFGVIASFWTVWLRSIGLLGQNRCISPIDVAVMMDLMKTSRLVTSPTHADHWIDKAGYAACGGEIALNGMKDEDKR